ncbi:MAG: hypothetical protein AAB400_00720 [Patescibacteria group bacterium]
MNKGVENTGFSPSFQPDKTEVLNRIGVMIRKGDISTVAKLRERHDISDSDMRISAVQDAAREALPAFYLRNEGKDLIEKIIEFLNTVPLIGSTALDPRIQEIAQDLFSEACRRQTSVGTIQLFQDIFRIDEEYVTGEIVEVIIDALADWKHAYATELMTSFQAAMKYFSDPEQSAKVRDILETIFDQEWAEYKYEDSAKLFAVYRDILAPHDRQELVERIEHHILTTAELIAYPLSSDVVKDLERSFVMATAYGIETTGRIEKNVRDAIDSILDEYYGESDFHEIIQSIIKVVEHYGLRDAMISSFSRAVGKMLINGEEESANEIAFRLHLTSDELKVAAGEYIAYLPEDIESAPDHYGDEDGSIDNEKVQTELRRYIKNLNSLGVDNLTIVELCFEYDLLHYLIPMCDELGLSRDEWRMTARTALNNALAKPDTDMVSKLLRYDLVDGAISLESDQIESCPVWLRKYMGLYDIDTLSKFVRIAEYDRKLYNGMSSSNDRGPFLTKDDLAICHAIHIFPVEGLYLLRSGHTLPSLEGFREKGEQSYVSLFKLLHNHSKEMQEWNDTVSQNLVPHRFETGAQLFGYGKMFFYIDRNNLSRHDALYAFDKIIVLVKTAGLSAHEFFGRILRQVAMDDSHYDEGSAHHKLNEIASSFNPNCSDILEQAQQYATIPRLAELASQFSSLEDVFVSWKSLKKYAELCHLIGQTAILKELQELKCRDGESKLYQFVETLAFHPTSNVSIKDIMLFWRKPQDFLSKDDSHADESVHERKKPSNYTDIPNLDLTATELRDALVGGVLDRLQAFPPFTIEYELDDVPENLRSTMIRALGARKNHISGEAQSPKALYYALSEAARSEGVNLSAYLNDAAISLNDSLVAKLSAILYDERIGITRRVREAYRAKINAKSDPQGVLAGNDTACCMSFDSGKNAVYMFNPIDAMFTIQRRRSDGVWRTVAQSLLTKDADVGMPVPAVMDGIGHGKHICDVIPAQVLSTAQRYLSADNIEIAPNVKTDTDSLWTIEKIYKDFFAEYLVRYAPDLGLHGIHMPIGMGYTDTMTTLPKRSNTFVPLAPLSYSDKTGENVYLLTPSIAIPASQKKIIHEDRPASRIHIPIEEKGIDYLTFQDTLQVAYLEGKIYKDNQELIVNLHNIENALIAKDITNELKGRPNLSVKYTDSSGQTRGYVLAYEGRLTESDKDVWVEDHRLYQQPIVYVSDLASDRSNPFVGGRLIKAFFELYQKNYLDQGNMMPIYFEARESTTHQLLSKQIERIQRQIRITFSIEEIGDYQKGKDTMKALILIPQRELPHAA